MLAKRNAATKRQQQQQQQQQQRCPSSDWQEVSDLEDFAISKLEEFHKLQRSFLKLGLFDLPVWSLVVPILLFALATSVSHWAEWHRLSNRHLQGRTCVMNIFVDRIHPNEFNPDYNPKTPTKMSPSALLSTTYRTKGQVAMISRFIGCVADSYRTSHMDQEQAIVFSNARDGGHLAQEALLHWPQRGDYATQLYIVAAREDGALDESMDSMEERFINSGPDVHIYDWELNMVLVNGNDNDLQEDDDDGALMVVDIDRRRLSASTTPSLPALLVPDVDQPTLIPYFHVDGYWKDQLQVLESVKPLLQDHTIVVIGMEHAPDLNILEMMEFYTKLEYKTFMLGLRQLTRIDNLCPEVLENVLAHPTISHHDGLSFFHHNNYDDELVTPPFFVAMPKGRHEMEEMTIQHMYDLFSGEGGGGQVKTANDRKAPSKKKAPSSKKKKKKKKKK
jgi:hypothetical protein